MRNLKANLLALLVEAYGFDLTVGRGGAMRFNIMCRETTAINTSQWAIGLCWDSRERYAAVCISDNPRLARTYYFNLMSIVPHHFPILFFVLKKQLGELVSDLEVDAKCLNHACWELICRAPMSYHACWLMGKIIVWSGCPCIIVIVVFLIHKSLRMNFFHWVVIGTDPHSIQIRTRLLGMERNWSWNRDIIHIEKRERNNS